MVKKFLSYHFRAQVSSIVTFLKFSRKVAAIYVFLQRPSMFHESAEFPNFDRFSEVRFNP